MKNLIAGQIDREIVFMSYIEMFIDSYVVRGSGAAVTLYPTARMA